MLARLLCLHACIAIWPPMNEMSPLPRPERVRKPDWIRVKAPTSEGFAATRALMR